MNQLVPIRNGVVGVRVEMRRELFEAISELAVAADVPFAVVLETWAEVGRISHQLIVANREELNAG